VNALAARIHAALPQTQCTRCGYPDCAAYATAIASAEAPINQCPPGGAEGIERLAAITGQAALPLNPANGTEGPRSVAVIDEDWCIGCTLCIAACPTDAILGSHKMHTVVERYCTGCELCIPVCPVDCISLEPVTASGPAGPPGPTALADEARTRYERRTRPARARKRGTRSGWKKRPGQAGRPAGPHPRRRGRGSRAQTGAVIEAALARARARAQRQGTPG
jgi:electron transport complex protein RnfB